MPRADFATLCNAAQEANGLVSMLGAFVSLAVGPELPIRQMLFFVARVSWDLNDFNQAQLAVVTAEHDGDGEVLARVEMSSMLPPPPPDFDPDLQAGSNVIVPLPLELRRTGLYWVSLTIGGELHARLPLKVITQLPPV